MNIEDTMTFSIDKERYEYHYRKKRRKRTRLFIALFLWVFVIIYLITPFSTYKMMNVKGNVYLTQNEVIELAEIKNTWWWLVDSDKLKEKLETFDNIDNVSVSKGLNGLNISILEKYPLAIKDDKYLMNTTLKLLEKEEYSYTVNNLIDISELEDTYLNAFANQYIHVDLDIRESFYQGKMIDNKIIEMKGKLDGNIYFTMYLNLDFISVKLSSNNFSKIKEEILGEVSSSNVEYSEDNPCIVKYNFTDVYKWELS